MVWKDRVPPSMTEVTVERDGKRHRADIMLPDGTVVELQHTPLSVEEIVEREAFYGKMIWVFDVSDCENRIELRDRGDFHSFRWKHPRKHIAHTTAPTYLDFGDGNMMRLRKMYDKTPCGGWGLVGSELSFLDWLQEKAGYLEQTS